MIVHISIIDHLQTIFKNKNHKIEILFLSVKFIFW